MDTSDYVLIFSTLFLGSCALFVPYLSEVIKRTAFAPKPKIIFKLAPPFCHKTYFRSHPQTQLQVNEPVYYFRFNVVNLGKSRANRCEVVLENLWVYDSSQTPQIYPNFSPINLRWVSVSTSFADINPERGIFCDIGHISSASHQRGVESSTFIDIPGCSGNDLRFVLDLYQHFYSQPNCLFPGRYIIQIGFYSDNAGNFKKHFDISWSGKWQDSDSEMFREIVIKKATKPFQF